MQEIKRVVNIRWIIFVCLLLLINAIFIFNNNKEGIEVYVNYNEMIQMTMDKKTDSISNRDAATQAWTQYFDENNLNIEQWEEPDNKIISARTARKMLMSNADYIDEFRNMIDRKISESENILKAGMYEEGSFENQNLIKTRKDLLKNQNLEVSVGNGIWLEKLYENYYIQFFIIIILLLTVYSFFAERKNGLYYIIHCSPNGRRPLFFKRSVLLFAESLIISCLFYLESVCILLYIYGGIEGMNQPAAGDEVFFLTSQTLTRLEFVGTMILTSAISAFVMSLFLWFVLAFFNNINIGMFVYLMICGVDIMLYALVSSKNILRVVRFINIYYLFFPNKSLAYYNWGYSFGIASLTETTVLFIVVFGIVLFIANYNTNINMYFIGKENILEKAINELMQKIIAVLGKLPNFYKELYKVLVSQKAGIIILLLLYIVSRIQVGSGVIYSADTGYLSKYYDEAEGLEYSSELEKIYQKYQNEYEIFLSELSIETETYDQIKENRKKLLDSIRSNVDYIKEMNENGTKAVVLKPYEYMAVFGKDQSENQKLLALLNIIAVIVISSGFMSYENRNNMNRLPIVYSNRRSWIVKKLVANCILIAFFEIASYGIYYYKLFNVYDIKEVLAPLKSLPEFREFPVNPPIAGFILLDIALRFIILICLSSIMCYISVYIKYIYCMIAGMTVTLPQLLYLMEIKVMDKLSIGRYIAMLPCFFGGEESMTIYYLLTVLILVVGGGLYIHLIKRVTVSR